MFHQPKHPTLSRRRHLTLTVLLALLVLFARHAWNATDASHRQDPQAQDVGGQWKAVHAALGVPSQPAALRAALNDTAYAPFVSRFDLRKRAALVGDAKGRSAPLFLARDAVHEPAVPLEETRRSFREAALTAKGRAHERETASGRKTGRGDDVEQKTGVSPQDAGYAPSRVKKGER